MKAKARWLEITAAALVACGSPAPIQPADAGADTVVHKKKDAAADATNDVAANVDASWDRMTSHSGTVLASPHVYAIYIDAHDAPGPSFDAYLSWLLTSTDYWSMLSQYGVGYGALDGSVHVDSDVLLQPGDIVDGFIQWGALGARVSNLIHPSGVDAGLPAIPKADAYVVFINTANVIVGEWKTCANILGYHADDGAEPYAVIPACGHGGSTIAHEMAEMATDPYYGAGWYSDTDVVPAGGEIGDLCNYPVSIDGHMATELWSNRDGQCEPQ